MGTSDMMGKFWMCIVVNETTCTFFFGNRDDLVLKQEIVLPVQESEEYARPFDPRFFALSCDSYKGYFSMIQVDDYNHYQKYLTDEAKSSHGLKTGSLCNIAYCAKDGYEKGVYVLLVWFQMQFMLQVIRGTISAYSRFSHVCI